jgi:hypothetical protein
MTTKLTASPVVRELEYEIDGRKVLVGLESVADSDDHLTLRLSGLRTGWYVSLRELARLAVLHPRDKKENFRLRVTATVEDINEWRKEYEKQNEKK